MEVTSVVKQAVVLVLIFTTNGYGQLPQLFGSSLSQSQASAMAGVPQGSIILQNYPQGIYSDAVPYRSLSLPSPSTSQLHPSKLDKQISSTPSALKSLGAFLKNTAYVFLGLLDLTDANRHDRMRGAANNLNDAFDSIAQFFKTIQEFQGKILRAIMDLPVIGYVVRILEKIGLAVTYVPFQITIALKEFLRKTFSTKQIHPGYAVPGIPAYASA